MKFLRIATWLFIAKASSTDWEVGAVLPYDLVLVGVVWLAADPANDDDPNRLGLAGHRNYSRFGSARLECFGLDALMAAGR